MRVVTFAELAALPAGTLFCEAQGGSYGVSLEYKWESTPDGGFYREDLLPSIVGGAAGPDWQPATWCPPSVADDDPATRYFVLDPADVAHLVSLLSPG